MDKPARIQYIDYLKAIGMFFVILGHTNFANSSIKPWIYSFHMTVFFFASGLLLKNNPAMNIHDLFVHIRIRFFRLMIPYILWAVIYAPLNYISLAKIIYGSHWMLSNAKSQSALWFLPCLFVAYCFHAILLFIFHKPLSKLIQVFFIFLSFSISAFLPKLTHGYPWSFDISFSAIGFLLLGQLCFPIVERYRKQIKCASGSIIISAIFIICFTGTVVLYRFNLPYNKYVVMADSIYGNYIYFIVISILGIIMLLSFSLLLEKIKTFHTLRIVAMNTLPILAIHKLIILGFRILFKYINIPSFLSLIITGIAVTAISCIISILLNEFSPALTGNMKSTNNIKRYFSIFKQIYE